MSPEKLTYMANQIATAFASKAPDEAAQAIAEHINDFWDPRMRARLFDILAEPNNGLSDLAKAAAPLIRKPI